MKMTLSATFLFCTAALAAELPVQLFTAEDLAHLRDQNPNHYQRAEKLITAANSLCPPGKPETHDATLRSDQVDCGRLLMTSNPPKREIRFTLDTTQYVALVTITADPPKLIPAHP
jgi:hypothetical protein